MDMNWQDYIPCGHSYYKDCFDQDYLKCLYSCSQCRLTFILRHVLNRNTLLAEFVENLKKTGLQAAPPAHYYAGSGDVACDSCTGRKLKAVKSCLVCLASYCETHLQLHYESSAFKKHKLVQASKQLKEKIYSRHDKLLEIYCRTDQQFICYLCTMDERKGHDTVSAAAERTDRQCSAQGAMAESEKTFTELISSIERRSSVVKELIRAQEKAEVSQAERLLKQLEQEMAELRKSDAELEKLSHTDNHIHFLQTLPSITVNQRVSFEDVKKSVYELKKQLKYICFKEIVKMSSKMTKMHIIPPSEHKTREEFLEYSYKLSLDPNAVNKYLCLSEGIKKVTRSENIQSYSDHPERFTSYPQVLCKDV